MPRPGNAAVRKLGTVDIAELTPTVAITVSVPVGIAVAFKAKIARHFARAEYEGLDAHFAIPPILSANSNVNRGYGGARHIHAIARAGFVGFATLTFANTVSANRVTSTRAARTICVSELTAAVAVVVAAPIHRAVVFELGAEPAIVARGSARRPAQAILHGTVEAVEVTELASAIAYFVIRPFNRAVVFVLRPAPTVVALRVARSARRGNRAGQQRTLCGSVSGAFVGCRQFPHGNRRRNILVRRDR